MSYKNFAYYYDLMMNDVDYSWWLEIINEHVPKNSHILDVACGTGTIAIELGCSGYKVTGLDISEDMLVVASEKAELVGAKCEIDIEFIQKDMTEIAELTNFDAITITLDSLNYLQTLSEVKKTITGANNALNDGGILIFDVHTPEKITNVLNDYLFVDNDLDLTYIWFVTKGAKPLSIEHELTIFAKNEAGSYDKYMEHHYQKTFEHGVYTALLTEARFEILKTYEEEGRRLYVTKKIGN